MEAEEKIAVIAITRHGAKLGTRIVSSIPGAVLKVMARYAGGMEDVAEAFQAPIQEVLQEAFSKYDGLVLIMSLGAVVRLIAPLIRSKHHDPAVVVVDDAGRFVISTLSGHLGGANRLAERVATVLGATPVITTASDVHRTLAVDLLGRDFGWAIELDSHVTQASAAVVNGDPVAIWQSCGEPNWWPYPHELPSNLTLVSSLEEILQGLFRACLLITDLALPGDILAALPSPVVYRPKTLVVGIGCNRGTGVEEIKEAILRVFGAFGLSTGSLASFATVDLKKDEMGLLDAAAFFGVPVQFFSHRDLDRVDCPNPSEAVYRWVGTRGVAEPAAILASKGELIVPKQKCGNVTLAVARKFSKEVRDGSG